MTDSALKLSVLDQSPVRSGGTMADALKETLELARLADRLGYHRYWLAEHHNAPGFAGSAPEILIGRVAAETAHLRVGSGGVMLPHYSAYKVAETFRMLETLYPGRIDLGIGRAPGSDQHTAMALNVKSAAGGGDPNMDVRGFPQQVLDVRGYLSGQPGDEKHPFHTLRAMPSGDTVPEMWMLGSSDQSAQVAAHFGLPFSFAHFIAGDGAPILDIYREQFQPSAGMAAPQANIGVFVLCAESEEKAEELALARDVWRMRVDRGSLAPFPSLEEARAEAAGWGPVERRHAELNRVRQIVGTPPQVKAALEDLAARYGIDEMVVVTITHAFADRVRSYELLAEMFELRVSEAAAE
jgi:luciferase family oxidoreductase group 1